jgi:integrase
MKQRAAHAPPHVLLASGHARSAARAIQELAGHADLTTTQRYMHLSPAAIESAIRLLESPGGHPGRSKMVATETTETANPSR